MTTNEPPPSADDPTPSSPTGGLPAYGSVPPPEGGYPPPPPGGWPADTGGQEPYSPPAAISYGWRKFQQNIGQMIVATLIVLVVTAVLALLSTLVSTPQQLGAENFDVGEFVVSLVAQAVIALAGYVFSAMLIRGSLDVVDGGSFDIGRAFSKLNIPAILVTGLILSVLSTIAFALYFLPGIIFSIFSFFTIYFVVDRDTSPGEALMCSFRLVGKNFGPAFLTGLLTVLILIAGAIPCGVGLLVAVPIATLAGAYAYRRLRGEPVAS